MRPRHIFALPLLLLSLISLGGQSLLAIQSSEVPAGTRFMVELRDKLVAKEVKKGKKFEVKTLDSQPAMEARYPRVQKSRAA